MNLNRLFLLSVFVLFSFCSYSQDCDSLQSELDRKTRYIEQQKQVLKYYEIALQDCDTTNSILMEGGSRSASENKELKLHLASKDATIKSQGTIIKVLAGVVFTFVAGEVVRELVRKD